MSTAAENQPFEIRVGDTEVVIKDLDDFFDGVLTHKYRKPTPGTEDPRYISIDIDKFTASFGAQRPNSHMGPMSYASRLVANEADITYERYFATLSELANAHNERLTELLGTSIATLSYRGLYTLIKYTGYSHFREVEFYSIPDDEVYDPATPGQSHIWTPETARARDRKTFEANLGSFLLGVNAMSLIATEKLHNERIELNSFYERRNRSLGIVAAREKIPRRLDYRDIFDEAQVEEKITFDTIIGNDDLKAELKNIASFFKHLEVAKKWGAKRKKGILLYGPAGTGKTSFAQALANEIGGDLREIGSEDIYGQYVGVSEQKIVDIFDDLAKISTPTVVLFDEIDTIFAGSDARLHVFRSIAGIFEKRIESIQKNPNLIIVATTNHRDRLDQELIRSGRFDVQRYIELPNESTRSGIFAQLIARLYTSGNTSDINCVKLATLTEDLSGADIVAIFNDAVNQKMAQEIALREAGSDEDIKLTQADIEEAIKKLRRM